MTEKEEKAIHILKSYAGMSHKMTDNQGRPKLDQAIETVLNLIDKKDKMINEAYAKANNYLYFADSADYEVALWEVIRSLRPDLAEKWDNGEDAELKYIDIKESRGKTI